MKLGLIHFALKSFMKLKPVKKSYSIVEEGSKAKWINPNFIDDITFIADKRKNMESVFTSFNY